jgi:hypothetical protein
MAHSWISQLALRTPFASRLIARTIGRLQGLTACPCSFSLTWWMRLFLDLGHQLWVCGGPGRSFDPR